MTKTTNIQPNVTTETAKNFSISTLANVAAKDKPNWNGGIYFGAVPYIDAMRSLVTINENYGADSGRSIVAYFLSNATNWRGNGEDRKS